MWFPPSSTLSHSSTCFFSVLIFVFTLRVSLAPPTHSFIGLRVAHSIVLTTLATCNLDKATASCGLHAQIVGSPSPIMTVRLRPAKDDECAHGPGIYHSLPRNCSCLEPHVFWTIMIISGLSSSSSTKAQSFPTTASASYSCSSLTLRLEAKQRPIMQATAPSSERPMRHMVRCNLTRAQLMPAPRSCGVVFLERHHLKHASGSNCFVTGYCDWYGRMSQSTLYSSFRSGYCIGMPEFLRTALLTSSTGAPVAVL